MRLGTDNGAKLPFWRNCVKLANTSSNLSDFIAASCSTYWCICMSVFVDGLPSVTRTLQNLFS